MVGRIATGEVEEIRAIKSGRVNSGLAGAAARSDKLSPERRSEVARKAAGARWHSIEGEVTLETAMETNTGAKRVASKAAEMSVRMYPNNGLKEPVRKYESTFSAVTVIREMFFPAKAGT
jgi:hypothetical protein